MKKIFHISLCLSVVLLLFSACKEESDMAFDKVASPVFLEYTAPSANEVRATFFELDKTGILDNSVGIKKNPISNLEVEVSAGEALVGTFTTGSDGSIVIPYNDTVPNEFAGVYNSISFRIIRVSFD